MVRRSLIIAIPLVLILLSCFSLGAMADSPVSVFDTGDYDEEMEAGETARFEWVIYNNDSVQYIVQPSLTGLNDDSLTYTFSPQYATVRPDNSTTFVLEIASSRNMGSVDVALSITFEATKMNSPEETVTLDRTAELHVTSLFGTHAGENKLFGAWDNFLPSPLDTNYGAFVVTLAGWIGIALFVMGVANPIIHGIFSRTKSDLDDRILKIISGPVFVVILLYGVVSSLQILNLPRDLIANVEVVYNVTLTVVMVWISYKVYDSILIYYGRKLAKRASVDVDDVLVPFLEKLGMIIIPVIGIIIILDIFGYDITVLIAGMGLAGLVIAFAAQDTLSNFFSGISLILDRPFSVGELIMLEGEQVCEVKKVGLRSTTLYNIFTAENFTIPNNILASQTIVNMAKPDRKYKIRVKFGVAYGSDVQLVRRLILEAAKEHPNTLAQGEYEPGLRFSDFAPSSLDFTLYVWVDDVMNQWRVASEIRESVDAKFREHDVVIPFPQRTVWFHDSSKSS